MCLYWLHKYFIIISLALGFLKEELQIYNNEYDRAALFIPTNNLARGKRCEDRNLQARHPTPREFIPIRLCILVYNTQADRGASMHTRSLPNEAAGPPN